MTERMKKLLERANDLRSQAIETDDIELHQAADDCIVEIKVEAMVHAANELSR
jgi:hypothetical protein